MSFYLNFKIWILLLEILRRNII